MAGPRNAAGSRRMTQSQNDHVYELGKAGRKTGITLEDKGYRDEHGMEDPNIFSSPEKGNGNGAGYPEEDDSDDGAEDMEIDDGSEAGPATIRRLTREGRLSIPRARSPMKTHLQSPARQNPHLNRTFSPAPGEIREEHRASPAVSVNRRLDFSLGSKSQQMKPVSNGPSKVNGTKSSTQPTRQPSNMLSDSDNEPDHSGGEDEPDVEDDAPIPDYDDADDDDEVDLAQPAELEPTPEAEEPVEPVKQPGRRGRKPKSLDEIPEEPVESETAPASKAQGKKGRPAKATPAEDAPAEVKPGKRGRPARNSTGGEEAESAQENDKKRKRVAERKESREPSVAAKAKPGRKRKSSGIGVEPIVQRGPPLPKAKGLVSLRREGPDGMQLTRSGRHSFKPLDFWKGEKYDDEVEEVHDIKGRSFVVRSTKGVIRYEEPELAPKAKKRRGPAGKPRARGRPSMVKLEEEEEDEMEREDWETNPGRISGLCIPWKPEYEQGVPAPDEIDDYDNEELAISSTAIQLKDIKDATFRFAKTLTTQFFGTGIVDLPPGAEKRPKNSRRMLMSFFVHTGNVEVTVGETTFRIGKGGQFNVPRCNYYRILNDTSRPARVFFAQGCEVAVDSQSQTL